MTTCIYCGEPIGDGAKRCEVCGHPRPANKRFNVVLSFSLVGVVLLAVVTYVALSQLVWLPIARSLFYTLADLLGLEYSLTELPSQSLLNAPWLFGGAILYLPVVTILATRFGFKRATIAAIIGPLPFALMDAWAWQATEPPNLLHFVAVLLVCAVLGVGVHFLFLFAAARWPARATFIQGWALQPAPRHGHVVGEVLVAANPSLPAAPIESAPPALVTAIMPPSTPPAPEAVLPEKIEVETAVEVEAEAEPELVPAARVNESAPPRLAPLPPSEDAEKVEAAPAPAPPVWLLAVGLGVLIVVGIILIGFAFK